MLDCYKLSEPIFGEDYLLLSDSYSKSDGGYIVLISPTGIMKLEDREFYRTPMIGGGIKEKLVIPCSRRSQKKEDLAIKTIKEKECKYIRDYLDELGKTEITFESYK